MKRRGSSPDLTSQTTWHFWGLGALFKVKKRKKKKERKKKIYSASLKDDFR